MGAEPHCACAELRSCRTDPSRVLAPTTPRIRGRVAHADPSAGPPKVAALPGNTKPPALSGLRTRTAPEVTLLVLVRGFRCRDRKSLAK